MVVVATIAMRIDGDHAETKNGSVQRVTLHDRLCAGCAYFLKSTKPAYSFHAEHFCLERRNKTSFGHDAEYMYGDSAGQGKKKQ